MKKKLYILAVCLLGMLALAGCGSTGSGGGASEDADAASNGAAADQAAADKSSVQLAEHVFSKGQNLEFYGIEFMIPDGLEVDPASITDEEVCIYRGGVEGDGVIKVTSVADPDDGMGNVPDLVSQADALYVEKELTEDDMTVDFSEQGYMMDGEFLPMIRMGYTRDNGDKGSLMSFVDSERRYEDGYPRLYTIYFETKAGADDTAFGMAVLETLTSWQMDLRRSDKLRTAEDIRNQVVTDDETKIEAIKDTNEILSSSNGLSQAAFMTKMEEIGYTREDTEYALGIYQADWFHQALLRAETMEREGVQSQLKIKELLEGEQFEPDQAEYGAVKALQ